MSSRWAGKVYSLVMTPSGSTRARYSPLLLSPKLVCNSEAGSRRSLPEANTTRYPPAGTVIDGKTQRDRSSGRSVRLQPSRLRTAPESFRISIQSDSSPSLSVNPERLSARNSEMTAWALTSRALLKRVTTIRTARIGMGIIGFFRDVEAISTVLAPKPL